MPGEVEIRREPADGPAARALVAAMVDEVSEVEGRPITGEGLPTASPEEMGAPHGTFVVLYEDGQPVAGGGLKRLEPDVAEIKRMYVVPKARSRGLARRLLAALEAAARDLGYARVRLDTSDRQEHALALYRSAGYRAIGNYNRNAIATFWGEKEL